MVDKRKIHHQGTGGRSPCGARNAVRTIEWSGVTCRNCIRVQAAYLRCDGLASAFIEKMQDDLLLADANSYYSAGQIDEIVYRESIA